MYADKYSRRTKLDPGSMALALLLNGTIVAGLAAFAAPHFFRTPETHLRLIDIHEPPPPPPIAQPTPRLNHQAKTPIKIETVIPETIVPVATATDHPFILPPTPPTPVGGTLDGGFVTPVKPAPIVIGPVVDPHFAGSFQPEYPPGERRAQREGRVVVRVLIGTDGRVKQIERVSAASDEFFAATERRALEKWRFKPGTRDGVPVEAWRTMAVSFVLKDE